MSFTYGRLISVHLARPTCHLLRNVLQEAALIEDRIIRTKHRRLLALAFGACLILALGLLVRSRLARTVRPTPSAPLSEASALQQLSQDGQAERASQFVARRTREAAPYVHYLPATSAASVRWRGDTLLSVNGDGAIDVSRLARADSTVPVIRTLDDSALSPWVLVVSRDRDGSLLSMAGTVAGRTRAICSGREIAEMLLNVPLSSRFAGGGVFDIDGALVGFLMRCDQRVMAVPAPQVQRMLARADFAAIPWTFGMRLTALDSATSAYFGSNTGLLVVAVRRDSVAFATGVRPGDLLQAIDRQTLDAATGGRVIESADPSRPHLLSIRRFGKQLVLRLPARASDQTSTEDAARLLGIGIASPASTEGIPITTIVRGSLAYRAGLRPGDRLLMIDGAPLPSAHSAVALRDLSRTSSAFLAFERDGVMHGALATP